MRQEIGIKSGNNRLRGYLELPDGEITGRMPMVILYHGLCDSKETQPQVALADYALHHQMAVLRVDFNGHGDSDGVQEEMTIQNEVEDAEAILEYALSLSFVSKIIVIGHSQGGLVASLVAGKNPDKIDGLILLAPAAILEECAKTGDFRFVKFDPNNIPDRIKIHGWDFWLGRKYLEEARNLKVYENSKNYKGKVCLIQGEEDDLVPAKYAIQYERIYKDCRLYFIPECNHVFEGRLDELLNVVDEFIFYHILRA